MRLKRTYRECNAVNALLSGAAVVFANPNGPERRTKKFWQTEIANVANYWTVAPDTYTRPSHTCVISMYLADVCTFLNSCIRGWQWERGRKIEEQYTVENAFESGWCVCTYMWNAARRVEGCVSWEKRFIRNDRKFMGRFGKRCGLGATKMRLESRTAWRFENSIHRGT